MTPIAADPDRRVWSLSTPNTTYAMHVAPDGRLVQLYWGARLSVDEVVPLTQQRTTASGSSFHLPGDVEEQLPVDGGTRWGVPSLQVTFPGGVRSAELEFAGDTVEAEENGHRLDLAFTDGHFPLHVVLHYRVREDSDVVERWVTLKHLGAEGEEPFVIGRADSGSWLAPERADYRYSAVTGAWAAETQLVREHMPFGEFTLANRCGNTGHHANPWLMLDDGTATEEHGEVWGVALAWSGTWRITAQRRFEGRLAVTAGFGHDGVTWQLRPAEELTTPPTLGVYTDGGFGAASRAWHRHARAYVLPHPEAVRPVLYNSWEAVWFDVNEQSQLEIARKAADLGVELFVMDDGWFGKRTNDRAGLGDWWPNPDRFPNGLGPLADGVRKLGMAFGLWVEPEMVNPDSDLYRAHPDWTIHFPHRRRDELRQQLVLNFGRDDVRAWAHGWLDRLVADHGIDFLKWDMNRAISQGGWPERAGDQDRLWIEHTRGVYEVIDRLRSTHPRLRIESCSGGGGRVDYGILARTDEVWTSDNTDAYHRQSIQHGYSQLYPAAAMAAWVTDSPNPITGRTVPLEYRFHVAMSGVLGIGGNLHEWSSEELAQAREWIAAYKRIRVAIQHGDQYRLGAEPGRGLSAVEYVHGDDVVVFVYHPHATVSPAPGHLRLVGLDPDASYQEVALTTGERGHTATGRVLMAAGLPVRRRVAGGDWSSAAVRLQRIR
ncbi:alpha-galactosidase [Streptomyces sp. bgisy031]|uniref:alpha-galactosidase n=1 Tax=Streptomyces sp. bgisy031 TaxID=3413772 RepID=UPI003D7222D4